MVLTRQMKKQNITENDINAATVLINLQKDNEIIKSLKNDKDAADA